MKRKMQIKKLMIIGLFMLTAFNCLQLNAQVTEPYDTLNNGSFTTALIKESPDPLINYKWDNPTAGDALQIYNLYPKKITALPAKSFVIDKAVNPPSTSVTVKGKGSLMFDFGVESAAWLEFDSDDLIDSVEMSISEYNEPAVENTGSQNPRKTKKPVRYGHTYRLELNDALYEGVRFGWIHINSFSSVWHLQNIRLVCQVKPVNYNGSFACSDVELTRIWYTGAYVVKLNMMKDFFGAILMERSDRHSWTGDAYPAQAAALAAFGNYDVIKKNIAYTSSQDNGIAAYSMYWVLSLIDYYNYTGDSAFLKAYAGNAEKRLDRAYAGCDTLPQLGFMGWDERLGAGFENTQIGESQHTYRMLCLNAWKQFSKAMTSINETGMAEKYKQFADAKTEQLHSQPNEVKQFGVHAVSEAINAGITGNAVLNQLAASVYNNRLNRLSYSPFNQYFIIEAMAAKKQYARALTTIKDCWGGQLRYGGTSFFEVYRPSWNNILKQNDAPPNNQCGYTSLAHPWSAGVTKWLSEEILGIKPVDAGFQRFEIIPNTGNTLSWVKGSVPTPTGVIKADFNFKTGNGSVTVPPGTVAERIGLAKAGRHINQVLLNGELLWDASMPKMEGLRTVTENSGYIFITELPPGDYTIAVNYDGPVKPVKKLDTAWHYSITSVKQDSVTSGAWSRHYGKDGYFLFGYKEAPGKKLPAYIGKVNLGKNGLVVWDSISKDARVLKAPGMANARAAAIITKDPEATLQTFTIDVEVKDNKTHKIALYLLDYNHQQRRSALEIFDAKTLNIIAPVQLVQHYTKGKYVSFNYKGSIRIRVNQVRGLNAAVSGLFFD